MNFQEILKADIAHYEQMHDQLLPQPEKDQSVKSDVNFRRATLIGKIFMKYFPEVECFRPQLNKNANMNEYKMFARFLEKISKYKPVQNAWSQTIESKRTMNKASVSGEENEDEL